MDDLVSRMVEAAGRGGTVTFMAADTAATVPWAEVLGDAASGAGALRALGVGPGERVAVIGPTTRPLVTAVAATWLAGGAVVMLPLPMRLGSLEEFVAQTVARVRATDPVVLLVDPALADLVPPDVGVEVRTLPLPTGARLEPSGARADDLALIQLTSGSTAEPRGVTLTHRQLVANLDAIARATALDPAADVLVSWLPLYHDMGLIGLLTLPMTTGTPLVLGAPQDFLGRPDRWMEWISAFGGTATAGPNFAWVLATRALTRAPGRLDLSRLRVALNGAEPIDPDSVEAFVAAASPHRMDPGAVFCAFGMAEAALAVTFPPVGRGLRTDVVDAATLERELYAAPAAGGKRLAMLGRPLHNLRLRVVDPATGHPRGPREVGEIEIAGASVTSGYWRNPEATAAALHDGWLRTGDLGYVVDGELVVCGRIKDVIIIGGRNIFPEDIERAVGAVDGVRAGNVIAFGVPGRRGREGVVVVAEVRNPDPGLTDRIARRVREVVGVPPTEVVLVEPGSLPKTSSGKLQRSRCRDRWAASRLVPVG